MNDWDTRPRHPTATGRFISEYVILYEEHLWTCDRDRMHKDIVWVALRLSLLARGFNKGLALVDRTQLYGSYMRILKNLCLFIRNSN